jgi:hypothetical protein
MKIKLAEALLRRKELNEKLEQLKPINVSGLFETKIKRKAISESIDDLDLKVPKITFNQIAAGYDWYAKQLRLVDAAIQQANWITEIEVNPDVMKDYIEPNTEQEKK